MPAACTLPRLFVNGACEVTRQALILMVFVCGSLFGCGGGDTSKISSIAADAGMSEAVTVPDHTAGQACSNDKDCTSGTCQTEFHTNMLLGEQVLPAPGGYCTFACSLNVDCGAGGVCIGTKGATLTGTLATNPDLNGKGQCLAACDVSSQCRQGYHCVDLFGQSLSGEASGEVGKMAAGSCQVAPATDHLTASVAGAACSADDECAGGRCITQDGFASSYPGGYCSGQCLEQSDCGDHGQCVQDLGRGVGTCYLACASDDDCKRDGYRCRKGGPSGDAVLCLPGAKPLPNSVVGRACKGDAECGGGSMTCASQLRYPSATPVPGGYCSQVCAANSDCGAGGVCSLQLGAFNTGDDSGSCYKPCDAASDCRAGYECRVLAADGRSSQEKVCAPPLTAADDRDAGSR